MSLQVGLVKSTLGTNSQVWIWCTHNKAKKIILVIIVLKFLEFERETKEVTRIFSDYQNNICRNSILDNQNSFFSVWDSWLAWLNWEIK